MWGWGEIMPGGVNWGQAPETSGVGRLAQSECKNGKGREREEGKRSQRSRPAGTELVAVTKDQEMGGKPVDFYSPLHFCGPVIVLMFA